MDYIKFKLSKHIGVTFAQAAAARTMVTGSAAESRRSSQRAAAGVTPQGRAAGPKGTPKGRAKQDSKQSSSKQGPTQLLPRTMVSLSTPRATPRPREAEAAAPAVAPKWNQVAGLDEDQPNAEEVVEEMSRHSTRKSRFGAAGSAASSRSRVLSK